MTFEGSPVPPLARRRRPVELTRIEMVFLNASASRSSGAGRPPDLLIGDEHRGRIVESGPARTIWEDPEHPYTPALLTAVRLPVDGAGCPLEPVLP